MLMVMRPVVVAGHHRLARARRRRGSRRRARARRPRRWSRERQAEPHQRIDQPPLGGSRAPASARGCPGAMRSGIVRLSAQAGQKAGVARPAPASCRRLARGWRTAASRRRRPCARPAVASGSSSADSVSGAGRKPSVMPQRMQTAVLEVQQLPAVLAGEDFACLSLVGPRLPGGVRRGTPRAASPGLRAGMQKIVDEAHLGEHVRARVEGIEVGLAHAAVEAVDRGGQRQPGADQALEVGRAGRGRSRSPPRARGSSPTRGLTERPKPAPVSRVSTMCR